MSEKYPRYRCKRLIPERKQKTCEICGIKATHWLEIEYSYMRGEDGVYKVCTEHMELGKESPVQFWQKLSEENSNTQEVD